MSKKFARLIDHDDTQILAVMGYSDDFEDGLELQVTTITPNGDKLTTKVDFDNPSGMTIFAALELFSDERIIQTAMAAMAQMAPLIGVEA